MSTTPTPTQGTLSTWKRISLWLEDWAQAFDFDVYEYHELRIARLEHEIAALRSKSAMPSEVASRPTPADKEIA